METLVLYEGHLLNLYVKFFMRPRNGGMQAKRFYEQWISSSSPMRGAKSQLAEIRSFRLQPRR